jgi:hypothetical protein
MKNAANLLFEQPFNNEPLFKNQLDLVNQFLNEPTSPYHTDSKESEKYLRAQNRLKAYISQLLSATVSRNITEEFKEALLIVVEKKLKGFPHDTEEIVESILEALRQKNSSVIKSDTKSNAVDQFYNDLHSANYIAVITSKPLEIEVDTPLSIFSLRRFLFHDLIERLRDPNKDLKIYRFNFPMDSYGSLFWRGLKRILTNYLKKDKSIELFNSLHSKFTIRTETLMSICKKNEITDNDVNEVANEVLTQLNTNRFIMVFHTNAPIYGMPMIALNPAEHKNIKIYTLLEDDSQGPGVFKYSENDALLWRVFVWDKLKSKQYAGAEIKYIDA